MAIRRPKQPPKPTMEAILWKLHADLIQRCRDMLDSGEQLKAQELAVIRQVLRDNGIVSDVPHVETVKANLARLSDLGMPFAPTT